VNIAIATLTPLLPLIVTASTIVLLIAVISIVRRHAAVFGLTCFGILAGLGSILWLSFGGRRCIGSLFIVDGFSLLYGAVVLVAGFAIVLLSYDYLKREGADMEEFYVLLMGTLLGGLVLISAGHFATVFLGLETLSVSLYALIGFYRKDLCHVEGAVKYLILSGVSSAFILFGMALIYGQTGTMELPRLAAEMGASEAGRAIVRVGTVFILVAIGFKMGVVPFHMWTPDVYESAPPPVGALIASVSKGSIFAILLRYSSLVGTSNDSSITAIITIVALLSMVVGTAAGLFQNNVKRLLAYSSIAHFGYMLVAFVAAGPLRTVAVSYYLIAYVVTIIGAFGVVTLLSTETGDGGSRSDFEGLSQRHPWLAGFFALTLLSLVGMPLTAGFIAKVYVIRTAVESALWLPIMVLVVTSAISLFYYLRIILAMYTEVGRTTGRTTSVPAKARMLLAAIAFLLVWWGTYPAPLISILSALKIGL
jgi:NADH-quinone oxidoreductase subunit N